LPCFFLPVPLFIGFVFLKSEVIIFPFLIHIIVGTSVTSIVKDVYCCEVERWGRACGNWPVLKPGAFWFKREQEYFCASTVSQFSLILVW
jgi:hypothetical protein